MTVIRYQPWSLLGQVQNDLNRALESSFGKEETDNSNVVTSQWSPSVDIKEEDNRFVLYADLPGIEPADIEVTMDNNVLTLKGEHTFESEEDREGYHRVERQRGSFYRRFSLPDTADAANIEAKGRNGVLEIVIPKQEQVLPRKISVGE